MNEKKVVIHRDHTFEYQGEKWHVQRLGPIGTPDGEYELWNDQSQATISGFYTMADVREYVNRSAANGWALTDDFHA